MVGMTTRLGTARTTVTAMTTGTVRNTAVTTNRGGPRSEVAVTAILTAVQTGITAVQMGQSTREVATIRTGIRGTGPTIGTAHGEMTKGPGTTGQLLTMNDKTNGKMTIIE